MDMNELDNALAGFTGTENYWKHGLIPKMVYTDGVREMAKLAQAYWLLDLIFSYQHKLVEQNDFQIWTIEVLSDNTATVTCKEDTNEPVIVEQKLEYTTFPVGEFKLYFIGNVLLLPSEW